MNKPPCVRIADHRWWEGATRLVLVPIFLLPLMLQLLSHAIARRQRRQQEDADKGGLLRAVCCCWPPPTGEGCQAGATIATCDAWTWPGGDSGAWLEAPARAIHIDSIARLHITIARVSRRRQGSGCCTAFSVFI